MQTRYTRTEEQRRQWMAFIADIHPELDARALRLMDEMRMVAHAVHQLNEISLAETGLSPAQFRVLMMLLFCEHMGTSDGLNPSEISEYQGTSRNTISALIRGLEEDGLIVRQLDAHDRRKFNIHLTDAGRKLVMNHGAFHMRAAGEIFGVLSAEEMESLGELLRKLNQSTAKMRNRSCIKNK
jgi:DNA-binding MarR family transcriptional regulator